MKTGLMCLLLSVAALPSRAALIFNEMYVDVGGGTSADTNKEFVEILGTTGAESLSGIWLLEVEGDGSTSSGLVDMARDLTGLSLVNGLLTLGEGYSAANPWGLTTAQTGLADLQRTGSTFMENGAVTFLLVSGYTGAVGTDLDTNGDGILDSTPWTALLDSVATRDGTLGSVDFIYGPDLMDGLPFLSGGLDTFARLSGDVAPNSLSSWYGGQVDVTDAFTANVRNLPAGATITPGAANFPQVVPEPASGLLVALGAVLMRWTRRARRA